MPTWPTDLPQMPQVRGYEEQTADLIIRTQMDAGVPKTRRRFTAGVKKHTMIFHMTRAQVAIFDTFFETQIASGALSFDMTHPRTGASARFRIVPPVKMVPEPAQGETPVDAVWWVTMDLEQQVP